MDESGSLEGQKMLHQMTEVLGTPIPANVEGWPFPRKPVGPNAKPQNFKVGKSAKSQSRHSRSQRSHVKGKKNIFGAGWD